MLYRDEHSNMEILVLWQTVKLYYPALKRVYTISAAAISPPSITSPLAAILCPAAVGGIAGGSIMVIVDRDGVGEFVGVLVGVNVGVNLVVKDGVEYDI